METTTVRRELPPMPGRIARLPVHRGYPVPWFVAWLDEDGDPVRAGTGTPDFRIVAPRAPLRAHRDKLCWICGDKLGAFKAFVVGPMCIVNRTSSEPPMHVSCAEWSVAGCPFLTKPHMRRRENDLPTTDPAPGNMLERNPGVSVIWTTRKYTTRRDENGGLLFNIGRPFEARYFAEGRTATREEVDESIRTGLPALLEAAVKQGPLAVKMLDRAVEAAQPYLPES